MPIGYSPDDVFDVEASIDEGKPVRVKWKLRAITVAEVRKVQQLLRESFDRSFEVEQDKLSQAILIGVIGWDRPEPFSIEALDAFLSVEKKRTLAEEYPLLLYLSEREKKVWRSRQQLDAANSAKPAVGAVKTSPPNPSPSTSDPAPSATATAAPNAGAAASV